MLFSGAGGGCSSSKPGNRTAMDSVLDFQAIEEQRLEDAARVQAEELTAGAAEDVAACLRVALERGLTGKLAPILAAARRQKESDIEQLCHKYHGGYLESVQQLVNTRADAEELRASVVAMNSALQASGRRVLERRAVVGVSE
jgi:hypothetical protein